MISEETRSIFSILGGSPFFAELSMKERETIITELLWAYPELLECANEDDELGYEVSWFMSQNY